MHGHRESIERALLRAEPYRNIAERFQLSLGALSRHHAGGHVSEALVSGHRATEVADVERLLVEIDDLRVASKRILATAEAEGNFRVALLAIREARASTETLARIAAALPGRHLARTNDAAAGPVPLLAWLAGRVAEEDDADSAGYRGSGDLSSEPA